ncbi:hypothetical protein J4558_16275 [Leptolyngbya sp. 15MV]|nr:hypothetical protein J4558_16275 [Leptolyngbya sp. 15MV]
MRAHPRRAVLLAPWAAAAGAAPPLVRDSWMDAARGREIPVLIRLPAGAGPRPAVLISHGLGGSREGLGYLGRALAEAGFVVLHLQHPGTDDAVWRQAQERSAALAAAVLDVSNALARLLDCRFVLDELPRRSLLAGSPLAGRIDPALFAVAGHSYGAWVVQHLLGQRLPGGDRGLGLPDRRLSAGIALSPSPPRGLPPRLAFARVSVPILHVTGTRDHGWIEGATPEDREVPFRAIGAPGQVLAVLEGATHAAFADQPGAGPQWADPTFHSRIAGLAVLFLRSALLDDAAARRRLAEGAHGILAPGDRLELGPT